MIKFFRNQDIIVTPFTIAKPQIANSIFSDLIAANDGDEEYDEMTFPEWIAQCTIHELGTGKKLKYTPAKYSF